MKRAVHFILKKLGLLSLYSLRRSGYLFDKGWFQSFRAKASVDRSGRPIPWMTYAFLDFLEPRLRGDFDVFEFGSGNSTHWWAARVRAVSSCEHDAEWFARVSEGVPRTQRFCTGPSRIRLTEVFSGKTTTSASHTMSS